MIILLIVLLLSVIFVWGYVINYIVSDLRSIPAGNEQQILIILRKTIQRSVAYVSITFILLSSILFFGPRANIITAEIYFMLFLGSLLAPFGFGFLPIADYEKFKRDNL